MPAPAFPPDLPRLRRRLLAWYGRNRRDAPWRRDPTPYRVLVSEFMLQQTQVATVLPYFERFLIRFPNLAALAAARDEDVRAAWSGLGYYRRARNLQAAAHRLIEEHQGVLPRDPRVLEQLPGVGPYTAAALASIVHEVPAAVLDGNVIRVLARFAAHAEAPTSARSRRALQALADRLLDPKTPGDWNQAMMEFGATVCLPRRPHCPLCPWREACRGRQTGRPEQFPVKTPRPASVAVTRAVAVVRRGRQVLLVHRDGDGLLGGTWELPGQDVAPGEEAARSLRQELSRRFTGKVRLGAELARVKHAITNRRILLRAFAVRTDPGPRARAGHTAWILPEEIAAYPSSSMTHKVLHAVIALDGLSARRSSPPETAKVPGVSTPGDAPASPRAPRPRRTEKSGRPRSPRKRART